MNRKMIMAAALLLASPLALAYQVTGPVDSVAARNASTGQLYPDDPGSSDIRC